MQTEEVITRYFEYVNSGRWEDYVELFADNVVMDEQMLGHLEGKAEVARGIEGLKSNPGFRNYPREVMVKGSEAMVIWNIKSPNSDGTVFDFKGMNFFKVEKGKIVYFSNYHDTSIFEKS